MANRERLDPRPAPQPMGGRAPIDSPMPNRNHPLPGPVHGQQFNTDLLLDQVDRDRARMLYPQIAPVLDNPSLREAFEPYEDRANRLKPRIRRMGMLIAACVGFALIGDLNAVPGVKLTEWLWLLQAATELAGVLAVVLSLWFFLLRGTRDTWLKDRMVTELLRQWHFQSLLDGKAIEAACQAGEKGEAAQAEYIAKRNQELERFLAEIRQNRVARLDGLIDGTPAGIATPPAMTTYTPGSTVFRQVCEAYYRLRLASQHTFATYKVTKRWPRRATGELDQMPLTLQLKVAEIFSSFTLVSAMALSVVQLGLLVLDRWISLDALVWIPRLSFVAVFLAILSVIARVVTNGLGLEDELESYRRYQAALASIMTRYESYPLDTAAGVTGRLEAMREMEILSFEELKGFLRIHQGATFLI